MLRHIVRRRFCTGTPYHHDFNPGDLNPQSLLNTGLILFDFARIFVYAYLLARVTTKSFSYFAFMKNKFTNNPDYLLCDQETFERMKVKNVDK